MIVIPDALLTDVYHIISTVEMLRPPGVLDSYSYVEGKFHVGRPGGGGREFRNHNLVEG